MKHLFIPFELAVIAKEKGFDEPCFRSYNTSVDNRMSGNSMMDYGQNFNSYNHLVSAPLYQQIVDWFRDKQNIIIVCDVDIIRNTFCLIRTPHDKIGKWVNDQDNPLEYYTALTKAIQEAFKLI